MAISTFGIFVLSAQYLGAEGRGAISLYIANASIVQIASEIIFGSGYIYFIHQYSKSFIISHGFILSIFTGILIPCLLFLLNLLPEKLLGDMIITSILFSWMNWVGLHLRAHKQFYLYNLYYLISAILQFIIIWQILQSKPSVSNYILGLEIHLLISFILGLTAIFFSLPAYKNGTNNTIHIFHFIKKSIVSQFSTWLNFINTRISYYLIYIFFSNNQSLGIYSAATTFTEAIWIVPYALATPLYPIISSEKSKEKKIHIINEYASASFWLSLMGICVLLCIPEELLKLIIGKDFEGIHTFIIILSSGTIILSYSKIFWNYFQGNGMFFVTTKSALISTIAPLIIFTPILAYTGIYGIAYMTCFSYFTYSFLLLYYYQKETRTAWKVLLLPAFRLFPRL